VEKKGAIREKGTRRVRRKARKNARGGEQPFGGATYGETKGARSKTRESLGGDTARGKIALRKEKRFSKGKKQTRRN